MDSSIEIASVQNRVFISHASQDADLADYFTPK